MKIIITRRPDVYTDVGSGTRPNQSNRKGDDIWWDTEAHWGTLCRSEAQRVQSLGGGTWTRSMTSCSSDSVLHPYLSQLWLTNIVALTKTMPTMFTELALCIEFEPGCTLQPFGHMVPICVCTWKPLQKIFTLYSTLWQSLEQSSKFIPRARGLGTLLCKRSRQIRVLDVLAPPIFGCI